MLTSRRAVAAAQLLLLFPALLFMTAVVVRHLPSLHGAQQIVMWYAGRVWTLRVLLIALPLAVLGAGFATLAPTPFVAIQTQPPARLVAAATLIAAIILAIVGVHMLAN